MTIKNVQSFTHSNGPGAPVKVGDFVRDGMTLGGPDKIDSKVKVLGVWEERQTDDGFTTVGIKLDSDYPDGLRHPWEISNLADQE